MGGGNPTPVGGHPGTGYAQAPIHQLRGEASLTEHMPVAPPQLAHTITHDNAADKARASDYGAYVPVQQPFMQAGTTVFPIQLPPMYSEEQGVGKSPGFRWPFHRTWGRKAPNPTRYRYGWPMRHVLPVGREVTREGWNSGYLLTYLQGNRHAWPAGGIIEYPRSTLLNPLARRLGGSRNRG
jgi:hypothetical protein